jgi:glycosyltransferase involved in cell wall biosynthesis
LREDGVAVEVGLFGEGKLGSSAARLGAMGAEVVNRRLSGAEIGTILSRFHALVLSNIEASQSGVAAAAFGAGLPVIATPVGGLIEQVQDGITGVLAQRADATALVAAATRLLLDPELYRTICQRIVATCEQRSMLRFVEDCISHAMFAHTRVK